MPAASSFSRSDGKIDQKCNVNQLPQATYVPPSHSDHVIQTKLDVVYLRGRAGLEAPHREMRDYGMTSSLTLRGSLSLEISNMQSAWGASYFWRHADKVEGVEYKMILNFCRHKPIVDISLDSLQPSCLMTNVTFQYLPKALY